MEEFFYTCLEAIYRLGGAIIFGHSERNMTMRVMIISLLIGLIGSLPLAVAIVVWALYVGFFALWHPSLRDISKTYFVKTLILAMIIATTWYAGYLS
ncbi:MAG: hypothetical protein A2845_00355 [Candidatus Lloydbacteria bacterium RIFCSPHIGHO2_01_FULL_49_22]|uniref:Uncharacterized protein n=1 Tax=Candidatus Lloydbacteria bacterium RIFCSPHIGHO2_01_FULL_49_22 TaxID=1798658 RepID=A0A1G2CY10_9BACT|nr:MAG: hypothetical protein A2845_00355 [Candidatus Lloydbacteria bacterium RIFCSPHIGHO2_01_FULL_49_22]OGZ09315.1 MAG: hypothetical protein A3C14_05260 [Candidatus Lloydbacteria bacterium RIFCSPHIGHO2_02_FULL_50_18]